MEYLRDYIDNRANQDAVIPSNVGVNDVSLSALINKYNEMILERNRLLRTSSESNPVIIRKNSDLSAMRANIRSAINSVYKGLLISKEDIDRQASKVFQPHRPGTYTGACAHRYCPPARNQGRTLHDAATKT